MPSQQFQSTDGHSFPEQAVEKTRRHLLTQVIWKQPLEWKKMRIEASDAEQLA